MLVISGINELQETWIVGHFFSSFSRKSCRGWPWPKAMEAAMQKNSFYSMKPRGSPVETLKFRWKDRCVSGSAYQETLCQKVGRKSLSSIVARNTYIWRSCPRLTQCPCAFRLRLPCLACWRVNKLSMKAMFSSCFHRCLLFFHKTQETMT